MWMVSQNFHLRILLAEWRGESPSPHFPISDDRLDGRREGWTNSIMINKGYNRSKKAELLEALANRRIIEELPTHSFI